jgi:hypothetical protein
VILGLRYVATNVQSQPTRPTNHSSGYWNDLDNQRKHLASLAKKFQIDKMSDWYKLKYKVIHSLQTSDIQDWVESDTPFIKSKYNSSPFQLLSNVYPDFEWLPWKFANVPRGFWTDVNNQRKFINWAENELKINEKSDWYKISNRVIKINVILCDLCSNLLMLGVLGYCIYMTIHSQNYCRWCTLTMSGCHGDLRAVRKIFGGM